MPPARKYDYLILRETIDAFGARSPESIQFFLRPIGRSPQVGRAAENFEDFVPQESISK